MIWEHFFGVWTAVCSIAAAYSCYVVGTMADEYRIGYADTFDKRLWFIPGVLALLTAVFGSVTALVAK